MISSAAKFDVWDADSNGVLDVGADFHFNRFEAAQAGLMKFKGFNGPMGLPADYDWYPQFTSTDDLVTMKLPDGSLMKMFLAMQAADMGTTEALKWLAAIENYPAFSNGVTLGGHGVRPKEEALGAGNGLKGCRSCHATGGMMTNPIPVTRKTVVPMGDMGDVELPQYQWHFYNIHALADLGLTVEDEHKLVLGDLLKQIVAPQSGLQSVAHQLQQLLADAPAEGLFQQAVFVESQHTQCARTVGVLETLQGVQDLGGNAVQSIVLTGPVPDPGQGGVTVCRGTGTALSGGAAGPLGKGDHIVQIQGAGLGVVMAAVHGGSLFDLYCSDRLK